MEVWAGEREILWKQELTEEFKSDKVHSSEYRILFRVDSKLPKRIGFTTFCFEVASGIYYFYPSVEKKPRCIQSKSQPL